MKAIQSISLAALVLAAGSASAQDIATFVFNDNIGSNGSGSINLFKPKTKSLSVSGAMLEAFRQDNNGSVVFAVDVNEAASGSETSESQGLAIATAVLTVTINGVDLQFSEYRTPTRSLLAAAGSTERTEYYTLIGTAGTSRVSPNAGSELTNSSMDETLHFPVEVDLSGATAARLDIELLTTNVSLGDPEAFYDFSNGFEEVALLTRDDVLYLEALAPGRDLAPLVISDDNTASTLNWVYYPAAQGHYIVSYEDLYPQRGDYDFNDLVVAYQVSMGIDDVGAISVIRGNGYLIARGAAYDHDWHLNLGLPAWASGSTTLSLFPAGSHTPMPGYPQVTSFAGQADLKLFESVATIFRDGGSTYVNTFVEQALVRGPKFEFELVLDTPVPTGQILSAPFDPFLFVRDTGYEVHLVGKQPVLSYSRNTLDGLSGFRDQAGHPFAMVVPDGWAPPLAGVDIGLAYPNFVDYIASNGATQQQWYLSPDSARIKNVPSSHWKW